MIDITATEKMNVLMQVMSCVGKHPTSLGCIAHDCGFSVVETMELILSNKDIKYCERGFYINED